MSLPSHGKLNTHYGLWWWRVRKLVSSGPTSAADAATSSTQELWGSEQWLQLACFTTSSTRCIAWKLATKMTSQLPHWWQEQCTLDCQNKLARTKVLVGICGDLQIPKWSICLLWSYGQLFWSLLCCLECACSQSLWDACAISFVFLRPHWCLFTYLFIYFKQNIDSNKLKLL